LEIILNIYKMFDILPLIVHHTVLLDHRHHRDHKELTVWVSPVKMYQPVIPALPELVDPVEPVDQPMHCNS
jgi:hypothetical protein